MSNFSVSHNFPLSLAMWMMISVSVCHHFPHSLTLWMMSSISVSHHFTHSMAMWMMSSISLSHHFPHSLTLWLISSASISHHFPHSMIVWLTHKRCPQDVTYWLHTIVCYNKVRIVYSLYVYYASIGPSDLGPLVKDVRAYLMIFLRAKSILFSLIHPKIILW